MPLLLRPLCAKTEPLLDNRWAPTASPMPIATTNQWPAADRRRALALAEHCGARPRGACLTQPLGSAMRAIGKSARRDPPRGPDQDGHWQRDRRGTLGTCRRAHTHTYTRMCAQHDVHDGMCLRQAHAFMPLGGAHATPRDSPDNRWPGFGGAVRDALSLGT